MKQFILIMSVLLGWAFQSENIYAQTGGRTLIVYFSEGGNTRGIAEEIRTGSFGQCSSGFTHTY